MHLAFGLLDCSPHLTSYSTVRTHTQGSRPARSRYNSTFSHEHPRPHTPLHRRYTASVGSSYVQLAASFCYSTFATSLRLKEPVAKPDGRPAPTPDSCGHVDTQSESQWQRRRRPTTNRPDTQRQQRTTTAHGSNTQTVALLFQFYPCCR